MIASTKTPKYETMTCLPSSSLPATRVASFTTSTKNRLALDLVARINVLSGNVRSLRLCLKRKISPQIAAFRTYPNFKNFFVEALD